MTKKEKQFKYKKHTCSETWTEFKRVQDCAGCSQFWETLGKWKPPKWEKNKCIKNQKGE